MSVHGRRPARLLAGLLLVAVVAGCAGGSAESAEGQLIDALTSMSEDGGVALTFRIDSDEASLLASLPDRGPEVARMVPRFAFRMAAAYEDGPGKGQEYALLIDGEPVVDIRRVDRLVYIRGDIVRLFSVFGQPVPTEELEQHLVAGGAPPGLATGAWASFEVPGELAQGFSGEEFTPEERAAYEQAGARFAGIMGGVTDVERVGRDTDGDHLRITVPLRDAYGALVQEAVAAGMPMDPRLPQADAIPDIRAALDIWVKDRRLTVVSFDLLQLRQSLPGFDMPEGVRTFAIRVEVEPFDGRVARPEGAVPLDSSLFQGLMGGPVAHAPAGAVPQPAPGGPPAPAHALPPDTALVEFYNSPGYGQSRAAYCRQVADMPEHQRRHYQDICPG